MGLSYANFQVADLKNRKEGEIAGYYLESEDSEFVRYQGKCVRVIGTVKEGWQDIEKQNFTVNKQDTYQRSVLIPSEIEPLKYSTCNPYAKSVSESLNKVTLKGTIIRGVRPAPDIGYDYQLKLDEPYLDKSSFSGSPEKISTLDVAPSNNSLWETLEKSIGKKVKIEGFLAWGYSETRYLKATSVK
jgi:hypothetical protein